MERRLPKSDILAALRGKLIVSCQPVPGGPLDDPRIVAGFALAALAGGAAGLRIEGLANLAAVRAVTDVPVIGLVKADLIGSPVRITPLVGHVEALAAGGADIIALDATDRPRPVPVPHLLAAVRASGRLAMADCATIADGIAARALGFDILGSTMAGYTGGPEPDEPDLSLVSGLASLGAFAIAEGRLRTPAQARAARAAGADAVVAGSAITRPEHVTRWFADALQGAAG